MKTFVTEHTGADVLYTTSKRYIFFYEPHRGNLLADVGPRPQVTNIFTQELFDTEHTAAEILHAISPTSKAPSKFLGSGRSKRLRPEPEGFDCSKNLLNDNAGVPR